MSTNATPAAPKGPMLERGGLLVVATLPLFLFVSCGRGGSGPSPDGDGPAVNPFAEDMPIVALAPEIQGDDVLLPFVLWGEREEVSLEVLYSRDGGRVFEPCSGDDNPGVYASEVLGRVHVFRWTAAIDLGRQSGDVIARFVLKSGTGAGLSSQTPSFHVEFDAQATRLEALTVDLSGHFLSGVTVQLDDESALSDAAGRAVVTGLRSGSHRATFSGPEILTTQMDVFLHPQTTVLPVPLNRRDSRGEGTIPPDFEVTLVHPDVAGLRVTVPASGAIFPDGARSGVATLTPLDAADIAGPPIGQFPVATAALSPAGLVLTHGATFSLPVSGELAPFTDVMIWAVDPAGTYAPLGPGTVHEDGAWIDADPGTELRSGGLVVATVDGFSTDVIGSVLDEAGLPAASVWVSCAGHRVQTDEAGRFRIEGVGAGYDELGTGNVPKTGSISVRAYRVEANRRPAVTHTRRTVEPAVGIWSGGSRDRSLTDVGVLHLASRAPGVTLERVGPLREDGKLASRVLEVWGTVDDRDQAEDLDVTLSIEGEGFLVQRTLSVPPRSPFVGSLALPDEAFRSDVKHGRVPLELVVRLEATDRDGGVGFDQETHTFPLNVQFDESLPTSAPAGSSLPLNLTVSDLDWGVRRLTVKQYQGRKGNPRETLVQTLTFEGVTSAGTLPQYLSTDLSEGVPSLRVPDTGYLTVDATVENGLDLRIGKTWSLNRTGKLDLVKRRIIGRLFEGPQKIDVTTRAFFEGGVDGGTLDVRVWVPSDAGTLALTLWPPQGSDYLPTTVHADVSRGHVDLGEVRLLRGRHFEGTVIGVGEGELQGVRVVIDGHEPGVVTDGEGRFRISAPADDVRVRVLPPHGSSFVGTSLFVESGLYEFKVDLGRILLAPKLEAPLLIDTSPQTFGGGETISLRGRGFPSEVGELEVSFSGMAGTPLSSHGTGCTVRVPEGLARDGWIRIEVFGLRSNAIPYRSRPYISLIEPSPQVGGEELHISGSGFGATSRDNRVSLGALPAQVTVANANQLRVEVPVDATSGTLTVEAAGRLSNPVYVRVQPEITSVSPRHPSPLSTFEVSGKGIHPAQGSSQLRLSGRTLETVIGPAGLVATLPLDAESGELVLRLGRERSVGFPVVLSVTTLAGRVVDHRGGAVAGARVTVHSAVDPEDPTYFQLATTTGSDGSFRMTPVPTLARLILDVHDDSLGFARELRRGPLDPVAFGTTDAGEMAFEVSRWPLFECPTVPFGSEPVAVVLADLDHDELADLIVVNNQSHDVSVRLARDHFKNRRVPTYAVGQHPFDVQAADFDGDGHLDVVTANRTSDDVSVLLGRGDGTLREAVSFDVGREPLAVAVGDVDGDGHLDLVVANEVDDGISVLRGAGDGTFASAEFTAAGNAPHNLALGDLNHDGHLDVVTANFTSNNVSVMLGIGGGRFASALHYAAGAGPNAVGLGDVDGDGHLDVITADVLGYTVSVLLGGGNGSLYPAVPSFAGLAPGDVVVGDFLGDGNLDVATANTAGNDISVLTGRGDGSFEPPRSYIVGNQPTGIAAGAMDKDSRVDLVTANRFADNAAVLLADGPTFRAPLSLVTASAPSGMGLRDVDRDGWLDLFTADPESNVVTVCFSTGDGGFGVPIPLTGLSRPDRLLLRDLNLDRRIDVVSVSSTMSVGGIHRQNGDGSFTLVQSLDAGEAPVGLRSGRLDGDTYPDIAVLSRGGEEVRLFRGLGDGTVSEWGTLPTGRQPHGMALVDVDEDGDLDIVVSCPGSDEVCVFRNRGDLTFLAREDVAIAHGPTGLAATDFNGDGVVDLATTHPLRDTISVLVNRGDGTFELPVSYDAGHTPVAIRSADLNLDGVKDLVVGNEVTRDLSILIGMGDGSFDPAQFYAAGNRPLHIAVGDLNGDGAPDLVTSDPLEGTLIHLNQTLR